MRIHVIDDTEYCVYCVHWSINMYVIYNTSFLVVSAKMAGVQVFLLCLGSFHKIIHRNCKMCHCKQIVLQLPGGSQPCSFLRVSVNASSDGSPSTDLNTCDRCWIAAEQYMSAPVLFGLSVNWCEFQYVAVPRLGC